MPQQTRTKAKTIEWVLFWVLFALTALLILSGIVPPALEFFGLTEGCT